MIPRRVLISALITMGLGLAGAVFAGPSPSAAAPTLAVTVVAREFLYEPKDLVAKAGEITFTVKNMGSIEHDFLVETPAKKMLVQTTPFPAGKTVQVKARLTPGAYTVYCSIPGHREAGMQASLKVVP
jgi:uncharacterized cupredoxin-like copper-binding protein